MADDLVIEGRRLLAEATEGPWWREYGDVTVARPDPRDAAERVDEPRDARVVRRADHWGMRDPQAIADASLIVWLRNNAPALLDAVEANQRVREALHLDDDAPINPAEEFGSGGSALYGWDCAVDEMRARARRALDGVS